MLLQHQHFSGEGMNNSDSYRFQNPEQVRIVWSLVQSGNSMKQNMEGCLPLHQYPLNVHICIYLLYSGLSKFYNRIFISLKANIFFLHITFTTRTT